MYEHDYPCIGHWMRDNLLHKGGITNGAFQKAQTGLPSVLTHGPYITLPRGNYIAMIQCKAIARPGREVAYIDCGKFKLPKIVVGEFKLKNDFDGILKFPFAITEANLDSFEIRVHYTGHGELEVGFYEIYVNPESLLGQSQINLSSKSPLVNLVGYPTNYNMQSEYERYNQKALISNTVEQAYKAYLKKASEFDIESPCNSSLKCKICTQADMESPWAAFWLNKLGKYKNIRFIYYRKFWEFIFLMQVLYENGILKSGMRGLGFGCGSEPTVSLIASYGCHVTATDKPHDENNAWEKTSQYTKNIDVLYQSNFISRTLFDQLVGLEYVDMNDIPDKFNDSYDFVWSLCALEHLGSINKGLNFVINSLKTLKPGGIAVHTTEMNVSTSPYTPQPPNLVLYRKWHFETLFKKVEEYNSEEREYKMFPLDFNMGHGPLDKIIADFDWYKYEGHSFIPSLSGNVDVDLPLPYLKLSIYGFPATSFGLIITRIK